MPLWLLNIGGFLRGVPWQVYAGVALILAGYAYGCAQYDAGRESVLDELRKQQIEAQARAEAARKSADAEAAERAQEFEGEQEALEKAIENAETSDVNPLDNLFGGLRGTD